MKFFDLFAGMGGFRMGFELEGYRCVGFCEIDEKVRKFYKTLYDTEGEFEWDDVQTLPLKEVPDFDVLTAGIPCFPGDQLILTQGGIKKIRDIKTGELVITHKGRFCRVTEKTERDYSGDLLLIKTALNNIPVQTTPEHPFWTVKQPDKCSQKTRLAKYIHPAFLPREWIKAESLKSNKHYIVLKLPPKNFYKVDVSPLSKGKKLTFSREKDARAVWLTALSCQIPAFISYSGRGYTVSVVSRRKGGDFFFTDGEVILRIKSVQKIQFTGKVYNLEVEDDHSYTMAFATVHNCQPFSMAGKREGLKDGRAYPLWSAMFRLVEEKRPAVCVFENVKGLLSADRGWAFAYLLYRMDELGYDAEWTVFNSKAFGVPQNRERVYIVFRARGRGIGKVFPISEADKVYYRPPKAEKEVRQNFEEIAGTLTARQYANWNGNFVYDPYNGKFREEQIAGTLRTNYSNGNSWIVEKPMIVEKPIKVANTVPSGHRAGNVYSPEGIAPTFTENHGKVLQIAEKPIRVGQIGKGGQGERIYSLVGTSTTLSANGGGMGAKTGLYAVPKGDEIRIRRLTPLECFRLQGFPDWVYEKARKAGLSDSVMYKMAGNAVTVQIPQTIARKLKKVWKR
jgi:DNA (cytosine-5)-methyltransferase 1